MRAGEGRLTYSPALVARLSALAEAHPAREVCGFVVRRRDGGLDVAPIANAAAEADRAFEMDPLEELRVLTALDRDGGEVVAIYHSHVDAPAAPSARDRAGALAAGEPLWPGVDQVLLEVRGGRVRDVRRYRLERGVLREAPLD